MMTGSYITNACLLILFLPLIAFIINIFFGKRLPRQGDWVSVGAILITLLFPYLSLLECFLIGITNFPMRCISPG
ncbi:MAG: hypothetical protein Ct9H90mP20_2020 [Candidatus Neomarinimicrobiota bacterium]|nr:MAG: hypothetical protein Ct9H90mP20_2020 [Candidatus Neomarinimicrobiota bacterium]